MTPSLEAAQLARRLASLPELSMRVVVLGEYLQQVSPATAARILQEILRRGRSGGPPYNVALLSVASALERPHALHYILRAELYTAAKEEGFAALTALFFSNRTADSPAPQARERVLTLGHRKWKARLTDRKIVDKLLHDPEPEVLPLLLQNPRLVERDVVAVAAQRPTTAELQWIIFRSRRWIPRYAIKRALILNPFTPTDLSIRLLGFVMERDLKVIQSSSALPVALRNAAALFVR